MPNGDRFNKSDINCVVLMRCKQNQAVLQMPVWLS